MNLKSLIYPDRIGRVEYLLRYVPPNVALAYAYSLDDAVGPGFVALALFVSLGLIPFAVLPRVRDTGMSYWILVLALVPLLDRALGAALLFKRGAPVLFEKTQVAPARTLPDA